MLKDGYELPDKAYSKYQAESELYYKSYCELLLCMKINKDAIMVSQATSDASEFGYLNLAWKALKEKYEPNDAVTKFELISRMQTLVMKTGSDAETWVEELEATRELLEKNFNNIIKEEDFLVFLFHNLPSDPVYDNLKANFIRQFTRQVDKLTISSFNIQLRMFIRNKGLDLKPIQGATNEQALYAIPPLKCTNCGKVGHLRDDFTQRKGDEKHFTICNKDGHTKNKCPTKK